MRDVILIMENHYINVTDKACFVIDSNLMQIIDVENVMKMVKVPSSCVVKRIRNCCINR